MVICFVRDLNIKCVEEDYAVELYLIQLEYV